MDRFYTFINANHSIPWMLTVFEDVTVTFPATYTQFVNFADGLGDRVADGFEYQFTVYKVALRL